MVRLFLILILLTKVLIAQGSQSIKDTVTTEEIEVWSNRISMTKLGAYNKIQSIGSEQLEQLSGNKLADAVNFADGVFIKDYGFNSGLKTISLNATQSEHTVVLLDGMKINQTDNNMLDFGLLCLNNISRIEIYKGGSSALYGSEAIGGVINIITQKSFHIKPVIELKGGIGSYGLKNFYAGVFHNVNKNISYNLGYSYESSDNRYEYNFFNGFKDVIKARLNSNYFNHNFRNNFTYKINRKDFFELTSSYNYWNRSLPGPETGTSPSTSKQIDKDGLISIAYDKMLVNKSRLLVRIDYKYSFMKYFDTATFNQAIELNSFYKSNSFTHSSNYNLASLYNPFAIDFGYQANFSNMISNETGYASRMQASFYTSARYEISPKLISRISIYPSLRYDYYSDINDKNIVTAKLGLNVKPFNEINLAVKSSIGNNFRAPSFNDLYWNELGNRNLKSERSTSFDAGIIYQLKPFGFHELEFSYFNIYTTDRIVWKPANNIWRPLNIGKVRSSGIELSLNSIFDMSKRTQISFSVNYNFAKALKINSDYNGDPTFDKQLLYIPIEFFKSSFGVKYSPVSSFIKTVFLNCFYLFTGKRFKNLENSSFLPFYEKVDANIGINFLVLNSEVSMKFSSDNILNENYQVVPGYPMPLRNYKFTINFKY